MGSPPANSAAEYHPNGCAGRPEGIAVPATAAHT